MEYLAKPSGQMDDLREEIFSKLRQFVRIQKQPKEFVPGKTRIHYSGSVYDDKEVVSMVNAILDGWFAVSKNGDRFEKGLAEFVGMKHGILTNSGSSASLAAISTMCDRMVHGHMRPGDEVITPAVTFPTTLNPVIQNGLTPVLVDANLSTLNIDEERIESAITDKTKALILPHTLGNPLDMDNVMELVEKHDLFLLEDTCDALGSTFAGKNCGSFGDFSTYSFYPAHHLTLGEGGTVLVNDDFLAKVCRSIRDWGRACYCGGDEKNPLGTCNARFSYKVGGHSYDHKYMYTSIGYNLKPTEIQAAMGIAQLEKLPQFVEKRKQNFAYYHKRLRDFSDYFILPEHHPKADPSWFAFTLTLRDGVPFTRHELIVFLEQRMIETRLVFAGNVALQPAYRHVAFKKNDDLANSTKIMKDTFFIGVYPGLQKPQMEYTVACFEEFLKKHKR
ncbi:MAG: lipopolysaccharide biosynthesis protein RfbH [Candidatus Diapherotrites archaeon]|nr:lipopolysaccharide biosynthesis protein RfbH [Candidatus Diapherotrites archaeon]